ncbi:MAG TPA: fibronectin type III domain-containing protein [Bryobacteraceae bacterium]|nr:fibronectin type III domain-containing protein [Bryobacteraceae bacterium]
MKFKLQYCCLLTAATLSVGPKVRADVLTPPTPPATPAGYCTTIYNELQTDLQTFNQTLGSPASYPTLNLAQLRMADANTGPSISGPDYIAGVETQLQELQALGVKGVVVQVGYPVLYLPFYNNSSSAMAPYTTFYSQLATAIHAAGLKLVVENNVLLSSGSDANWTNLTSFYASQSWSQYIAGRATMAATVATTMQPDYLVLAEEPDTEAANTGQSNLNTPADAAAMISGEITSVRAVAPGIKLGAGFGSWLAPTGTSSLTSYISAYTALPLDYIDFHIYPINTENSNSLIGNSLTIASMAAAANMPVAISESWLWKMENSEYGVLTADTFRARYPFSFWQPLDDYFVQTMQTLANYTQMLYLSSEGTNYFFTYQTYGGTTANGGAANCTCTTLSCSSGTIETDENNQATAADQISQYTTTGLYYGAELITPPDKTAPTTPSGLTGTAGYGTSSLTWNASTDNIGVAGYNVYRCTPPAQGQSCTEVWLANSASASYNDMSLTDNTTYNYQVQAFDLAGNNSGTSNVFSVTTYDNTPPTSPTITSVVPNSPSETTVTWTPPTNSSGLTKYLVYGGTSPSNLTVYATEPSTKTSYIDTPLTPATTYYYGVVAVVQGLNSPMSNVVSVTTLPLPNAPINVTAKATSETKITLSWTEVLPSGGLPIANYQIYRGTAPGLLTALPNRTTTTTYNDTTVAGNTTYYYEIVANDTSSNKSVPSDPVSVATPPAPNAPSNVVATAKSATNVTVTWSETIAPNGLSISSYKIYRSTSLPVTTNNYVATRTTQSYTDTAVVAGTTYYYAISAIDSGNDASPLSNPASVTTPAPPSAPTNVGATANSAAKVTVTWTETIPTGGLPISTYKIYRSTSLPVTTANYVASRTTLSYTDTTVSPNSTYYYAIAAMDSSGALSPLSSPASVTTPPMPNAPTNVSATANSATDVVVTWMETVPTGGLPVTTYKIYRSTSLPVTTANYVASRTTASYTDTTVTGGNTYYYAIAAQDSGGDLSPLSSPGQATTP